MSFVVSVFFLGARFKSSPPSSNSKTRLGFIILDKIHPGKRLLADHFESGVFHVKIVLYEDFAHGSFSLLEEKGVIDHEIIVLRVADQPNAVAFVAFKFFRVLIHAHLTLSPW